MSVKVMAWVWTHSRSRSTARLTLLAIADCANDAGAEAYPSTATLARKAGLSERGVRAAVTNLVTLGELNVEYKTGPRGCNRYRVIMQDPEQRARSDPASPATYPAGSAGSSQAHPAPDTGSTRHGMPGTRNETTVDPAPRAPEPSENHPPTEPPLQPSSSVKPPRRQAPEPDRDDVEQICRHLADRIASNGSKRPTVTEKWRTSARLLLDADGKTATQVIAAIDWCQADEFWRSNILSMPKLREKYDQLRLAAARNGNARASPHRAYRNPVDENAYLEGL